MKKLNLIPCLICLCLVVQVVTGQQKWIVNGDQEASLGRYKNAIIYYKMALEKSPYQFPLFKKLGDCYLKSGDFETALPYYEKCMVTGKFHKEDSITYATLLLRNGKPEDAKSILQNILLHYPEDREIKRMSDCCRFAISRLSQPDLPSAKNLEQLNTAHRDYGPAYYGKDLVFSSTRLTGDFLSIDKDPEGGNSDLYLSEFNPRNQKFDYPQRIGGSVNTRDHEGDFTCSIITNTIFFSRSHPDSGISRIFTAKIKGNKWVDIKPVTPGPPGYWYAQPSLSSDGKYLFFVSDMPGGQGGKDIWKTEITPGGMVLPSVNLGPLINTGRDETYPHISGDTLLFFSSDGHIGMGGMDIFISRIMGNRVENPLNAGAPVNSTSNDFGLLLREGAPGGYFSSDRISGRQEDIFEFTHDIRRSGVRQPEIADEIPEVTDLTPAGKEEQAIIPDMGSVKRDTISHVVKAAVQRAATTDSIPAQPFTVERTVTYRIQVMAARQLIDPAVYLKAISDVIQLHGLSVEKEENYFKYRIGDFSSKAEAGSVLQMIRKRGLKDCFMVALH